MWIYNPKVKIPNIAILTFDKFLKKLFLDISHPK